jgi:hypothetical protein
MYDESFVKKLTDDEVMILRKAFCYGRQSGRYRFVNSQCPTCGSLDSEFETFADFFQHVLHCKSLSFKKDVREINTEFISMTYLEASHLRVNRIISEKIKVHYEKMKLNIQNFIKPNLNRRVYNVENVWGWYMSSLGFSKLKK